MKLDITVDEGLLWVVKKVLIRNGKPDAWQPWPEPYGVNNE